MTDHDLEQIAEILFQKMAPFLFGFFANNKTMERKKEIATACTQTDTTI